MKYNGEQGSNLYKLRVSINGRKMYKEYSQNPNMNTENHIPILQDQILIFILILH